MEGRALIVTALIIGYSLLMLGIGYVAWRRFRGTIEDYYLASRTVGGFVLFLTLAATYHSAFAFLTSVAVYSSAGVSFWVGSMLWTTLAAVGGYWLGKRFYKLGKAKGFITPADLLADFYKSEAVRVVTAILMALFVIGYMMVQSIGLGIILSIGSGGAISYEAAAAFFMAVTVIYLVIGGNRAAFWTDALQGVWMYIGIWLVGLFILFRFFGGPADLFNQVREVNPDLLVLRWPPELLTSFVVVFSLGIVLLPHLWMRYYTAIDERALKIGAVGMALYVSSYYLPAMIVGLAAAVFNAKGLVINGETVLEPGFIQTFIEQYGTRDAVMAVMVYTLVPAVIAGLLLAGAASAAMSTLDSLLGATSMILTRDIFQRYISPKAPERTLVMVARLLVIIWGLIAYVLAVTKPGLIFNIVAVAASGGLQFLPAAVQAVYPRFKVLNAKGVIAGVIAGTLVTVMFTSNFRSLPVLSILDQALPAYHAAIAGMIGLIVNVIVAVMVSGLTTGETRSEEYTEILEEESK